MKTNGTNPGVNVDEYENMAVQNSNTAKRAIAAGVGLVGVAAASSAATYYGTHTTPEPVVDPITVDDVVDAADVATTYQEEVHESTQKVVTVHEDPKPAESNVVWEESKSLYLNGEKVGTIESGTVDGHKFELGDTDGDGIGDYLKVDENGNGEFDENETMTLTAADNVKMGHNAAHVTRQDILIVGDFGEDVDDGEIAQNEDIKNDWEDEKSGESYSDDYAENNSDYNPDADTDYYTASVDEEEIQNDDITDFGGEEFLG